MRTCTEMEQGNFTSGEQKRQAAFDRIKQEAVDQGKDVGTAAINLAIELAVAIVSQATKAASQ